MLTLGYTTAGLSSFLVSQPEAQASSKHFISITWQNGEAHWHSSERAPQSYIPDANALDPHLTDGGSIAPGYDFRDGMCLSLVPAMMSPEHLKPLPNHVHR